MHTHPGERPNYARDFTMVETQALRKRTEAAVNALLALLDQLDGDADLEPALGAPETFPAPVLGFSFRESRGPGGGCQLHWAQGLGDDGEEEQHDAENDPAEAGYCERRL